MSIKKITETDERVYGTETIKARQVDMLKQAIDEVERGICTEFFIAKQIVSGPTRAIAISQACSPGTALNALAERIDQIMVGASKRN